MSSIKKIIKKIVFNNSLLFGVFSLVVPGYKRYKISSVFQYVTDKNSILKMLDNNEMKEFRRPAYCLEEYEKWNHDGTVTLRLSKSYISMVKNGVIIGNNDGIAIGDTWLNDRIIWDKDGLPLYPPNGAIYVSTKIICQRSKITKVIKNGIFLLKEFTPNYFHFTLEVICRLKAVDDMEVYDDWPLLLDSNGKDDLRTCQLLEVMNVRNHPIIWIEDEEVIQVESLLIPPILTWGARDLRWRNEQKLGIIVDKCVPEILRSRVLYNFKPKKCYDKVYVERGNNLRLINEDEVKEYLKKNGFEIFNPDKADFWQEVECFSTAKILVSVVGAAMTNVIYSQIDSYIIELCPFEYQTVAYTFLKETMGLNNFRIISPKVIKAGPSINKTTFYLDLEQCEKIVAIADSCNEV